jgi:1-acyl-sn-glycerol-3-phosphate acyltransferase
MATMTVHDTLDLGGDCEDSRFRRDPHFVEQVLSAVRVGLHWYAPEVRGMDAMPVDDPYLVVANHSGAMVMPDMWAFLDAWVHHRGVERETYSLAYDLLFLPPGAHAFFSRLGVIPASNANAEAAMDRGAPVLVYPGGDWEACRPFSERHRVDFHDRMGFVRLALRRGVPVVPVVSHGSHESLLILTRGERIARLAHLQWLRVNVFPIALGFPFGISSIAMPQIPLPTHVTVQVLDPLDWSRYGPDAAADPDVVRHCYDEITGRMQHQLDALAKDEHFAVLRRFHH